MLLLAIAGGRGIDNERVGHALWPDGDPGKMPSNLSSAAYDARQALGPEAWRLHRAGSQFWLDLDGAFVDLDDAMRRVRHADVRRRDGATRPGRPQPGDPADPGLRPLGARGEPPRDAYHARRSSTAEVAF